MHPASDPLSPQASPVALQRGAGVRRVNNLPLYIGLAALAVFLLVMALVAVERASDEKRAAAQPPEQAGDSSALARSIASAQPEGLVQAAAPSPPALPPEAAAPAPLVLDIVRPDPRDTPPLPPSAPVPEDPAVQQEQRARQRQWQLFEEAIQARTRVRLEPARSQGSAPQEALAQHPPRTREEALARLAAMRQRIAAQAQSDPGAAYQARLQQLQQARLPDPADGTAQTLAGTDPAMSGRDGAPDERAPQGGDRWQLPTQTERPRSPYLLRAGFVLPAVLISGINSDLPGQILAQVSQDVFDTATGRWKLIPQGARLVGQYASEVAYGQARVLVRWQRIVFPDGRALDIGAMPGADGAGYAGLHDQVHRHAARLFGGALLMSGVTAGIGLSQRDHGHGTAPSVSSALSEALGQQLGQVAAQWIANNMGVAPTLQIRPGYRFNVVVTQDLAFAGPYQAFSVP